MSRLALSISDRSELMERLGHVGRVLKFQAIVTWSLRLLIAGLLLDCLWLLGSRLLPYGVRPMWLLIAPAALAIVGGLLAGLWPIPSMAIARRADRDLGLKERLVTALELQRNRKPDGSVPLAGLQLRDTVEQFRRYEALESFPVKLPTREVNLLLVLSLLAIGLVLAPNPMEQTVRQREQVAATITQEAERIEKLSDELAVLDEPEDFADIQDVLRQASEALAERQLSPEQANAALQRLEQELLSRQDPTTGDLEDALASLAGSLASESTTRDLGTSLARGDVRQAASEMRQLAEQIEQMSAAERLKLSRSLSQAGNRASRANAALAQALTQGGEALEGGDAGQAAQALNQAADELERAAGPLRAANQRERALSQLQQSRSAINRAQQQAGQGQGQGQTGQRGAGQQAGTGAGEMSDEFGGMGSGEGQDGSGDQPGGSGAGSGQGSGDEAIFDPSLGASSPDFVPGQTPFDPNETFENPSLDSPYGNEAQVGYKQVYAEYQQRATQTLENTYIPAGLKDIVKDYFSALAPDK
jgi:hypothetical protein